MSAESDLYAILASSAPLSAVVGPRIYPDAMPEEGAYPALVFSRTATDPVQTIDGVIHAEFVTFALGCWANTRGSADAAADAAVTVLVAAGAEYAGRESGFDPETGLYATTVQTTIFATP